MIAQVIDWNVGPIIADLKFFQLRWYPLMFVISFLVGFQMVKGFFIREKKNIEELDWLLFAVLIGTILGARVGHYLFYDWQLFFSKPLEVFLPIEFTDSGVKFVGYAGLASHGAVFGIFIALYLYARKFNHHLFWVVDRVVVPTAFAAIFIRLGNFFNHEIVGAVADNIPWAVQFKYHTDQLPRHPAQIYESLSYLAIFVLLFFIYKKNAPRIAYGKLFGLFMMLIFGARFVIEFFKESQNYNDNNVLEAIGLNIGQLLSLPMIAVGAFMFFYYAPKWGKQAMQKDLKLNN